MQLGCLSVGLDTVVYHISTVLVFITLEGLEPFFLHLWCTYFLLLCLFVVSTSHMELSLSSTFGRFLAINGFWQCTADDQTAQSI